MTDTGSIHARIQRRETHSPRAILAIVIATILILVFAWLALELMLSLLHLPALLVAPTDMLTATARLATYPPAVVASAAVLVTVIGLVLIIAALAPGRRARHLIDTERAVTVVDNEVIASALARTAAEAGGVARDNALVTVSYRRAVIRITPTSGVPVSFAAVTEAVTEQLQSFGLRPPVTARVVIDAAGKVGA
ncbi:DUF6286 domain-containing protein [Leifsonia shinshuensis]|uniref:DUF6286 domain-containing protein n=1 Tax=Leifsonia TaxID=110932 RepID=UPI001F5058AB|nr:DUF6286 domain-containing protein [Leifsonia shinshuensis]MCI0158733.1 hypothetical protein [Leifsonia shinshuensis]